MHTTRADYAVWIGLFVIAVLVTTAAKYSAYFPGDVAVERWVQSLLPQDLDWAGRVSRTAEFPWIALTIALVFVLSWVLAGWQAALISLVSLAGMLALGNWLGPVIGRPRPSAELVGVFRPFTGYSFPSLFALRYAATFGFLAVLAMRKSLGTVRAVISDPVHRPSCFRMGRPSGLRGALAERCHHLLLPGTALGSFRHPIGSPEPTHRSEEGDVTAQPRPSTHHHTADGTVLRGQPSLKRHE